jgi:hypothetical protein
MQGWVESGFVRIVGSRAHTRGEKRVGVRNLTWGDRKEVNGTDHHVLGPFNWSATCCLNTTDPGELGDFGKVLGKLSRVVLVSLCAPPIGTDRWEKEKW